MHKTSWWAICAVAALAAVLGMAGCDSSDSGSSVTKVTLTVGEPSDQSIDANDTIKYSFTTEQSGTHNAQLTDISTGDASTLDYVADASACIATGDAKTCSVLQLDGNTYTSELPAGESFSFKIEEVGGEDTTFVIEIVVF